MGTVGSSASQVQALPRDQWEEITLSGTADKFLSYGQFKIYRNSVTNEEI